MEIKAKSSTVTSTGISVGINRMECMGRFKTEVKSVTFECGSAYNTLSGGVAVGDNKAILVKEFENKELVNTYEKNGFTVKTYRPKMSDKERTLKDAQIKYDIINIIKNLNA